MKESGETHHKHHLQHKGISNIKSIRYCVCKVSFGCSYGNEHQKSRVADS